MLVPHKMLQLADARKGVAMFQQDAINVPVLGIIENMAYFTPEELPQNKYYIFGKEGARNLGLGFRSTIFRGVAVGTKYS